jgi:hypothetical protein
MVDFNKLLQRSREAREMAKTAATKGAGTSMAKWDADLAAMAQLGKKTANERAGATTQAIGTQGGRFSIDGVVLKETTIDVVVIGSVLHNRFYLKPFDPKNPETPDCYAFGETTEEMKPDLPNVPHRQHTDCETCPQREWGSDPKGGKGKACSETVKLVTFHADDLDDIMKAPERSLSVPPTSGSAFSGYTDDVYDTLNGLPVAAVVTQVEIGPGKSGTGHSLSFSIVEPVDKDKLGDIVAKHKKVMKTIDQDYPAKEETAPARGGRGNAPAKGAAKKAVTGTAQRRKYA